MNICIIIAKTSTFIQKAASWADRRKSKLAKHNTIKCKQTEFSIESNSGTVDTDADTVDRSHFDLVRHVQRQVVDSDGVDGRFVSK